MKNKKSLNEKEKNIKRFSNLTDKEQKKQRTFFLFLLVTLSVLLYANTISHDYAFDDSVAITDNQFTKQGIKGIPDLLTKDFFAGIYDKALELGGGRYRPLSLITFAIEYQIFGLNPSVSHSINILFYALIAYFLFLTLEFLFPEKIMVNALICLLFVAHPVHTEVVANIKSRDELLAFLGLILTLYFLFKYNYDKKNRYLISSLVCYFLSLLSKENGITFLAVLPFTLFFFTEKSIKESFQKTIPYFIIGFLYIVIRTYLVGMIGDRENNDVMENPFVGVPFLDRMATIFCILGKYLKLLFFPHPLSSDYSFNQIPIINWGNMAAILPFLVYVFLLVYAIFRTKQKDPIAYGILFYLLTISIVSNIVFNIGAPMGERFIFLPSLGIILSVSILGLRFLKQENEKKLKPNILLLLTTVVIISGFSYKTIQRNKDWKDNTTLFGADVKNTPNSAKIQYYYANTLLNKAIANKTDANRNAWLQEGLVHAQTAVNINPKFHHAHYCLGQIYQELSMGDQAIASFQNVLKLQPTHILTQSAIGTAYGKLKGNYDEAIHYLEIAIKYNANDGSAYENLGIAYAMKQRYTDALKAFENALRLKPESANSYINVAITYQNRGEKEKAKQYFEKAFQLDPSLRRPIN